MPSQRNLQQVQQITQHLQMAQAVFLVDHQGLSANDLNQLRAQIRAAGGQLVVVKNTLFQYALTKLDQNFPLSVSQARLNNTGNSAVLFANQDQIEPLKSLVKFAKANDLPTIKLGLLNHQILTADQVNQLAQLPGQDQLRAQVVGMLQSPLRRLASTLNNNLQKLAIVLSEIKNQKPN